MKSELPVRDRPASRGLDVALAHAGPPQRTGSTEALSRSTSMPCGVILTIAVTAGCSYSEHGPKHSLRCPFHQDEHPSAFLDGERNIFYCSVCTPDGGWSARRFAEALGVPWEPGAKASLPSPLRATATGKTESFTAAHALQVWDAALARARDDAEIDADRTVYEYLRLRGLLDAWELGAFGIVAAGMVLPAAVAGWPRSGHQVVVPLYDPSGDVANVQARAIGDAGRKTLFPTGSTARGMLFASRTGLAVLKQQWTGPKWLILGEGLTDFLALTITSPVPVMCAPGAGLAATGIGPWIAGFDVLLALDDDAAGATARTPTAAAAYQYGARSVRRAVWPGHVKDACDVLRDRGSVGLAYYLHRELEGSRHE